MDPTQQDDNFLTTLIAALRSKESGPDAGAVDKQTRGYQLAVQEAKAMGEQPPTYEDWIAQASSVTDPVQ